jgi:soluble lytic murein transglycosylase-like protein
MQKTTLQIMIGLALIAPAGLMAIRDGKLDLEPTSLPIVLQPVEAVASAEKQTVAVASLYADKFDIPLSLAQDIHLAARVNGISPKVAFGLVRAESSFRPAATSPVGAVGLTQLMPATARMFKPGVTRTQLKRPETNLNIGFRYLRELIDRYNGNEKLALTAFNRGPGTVDKLLKHGRNPDNGYAEKVMTGKSSRHVALMNAKFNKRRRHRS